jgi:hypothetical protein
LYKGATRQYKKLLSITPEETDKKRNLRKSSTVRRYTVSKSSTTRNLAAVILAMILAETNNAKIAAVIDITNETIIVCLLTNIESVREQLQTKEAQAKVLQKKSSNKNVENCTGCNIMDKMAITPLPDSHPIDLAIPLIQNMEVMSVMKSVSGGTKYCTSSHSNSTTTKW